MGVEKEHGRSRSAILVRGTGSIGMRHLNVLRADAGVVPVAFPTREVRVAELRESGINAVSSLAELGQQPLAGAIVATDTGRHLRDAHELLPHADLLIEKPLAPSARGLGELERAAEAHGRQIYVAFCLRMHMGLQRFREQLPRIGKVVSVRIECQSFLPDWRPDRDYRQSYSASLSEGGVLRDLSHEVDYAVWMFGRPREISALLANSGRLNIEGEESADLLWEVPSGPVVSIRLDYLSRHPRRRVQALGDFGEICLDLVAGTLSLHRVGVEPEIMNVAEQRDQMMIRQARAFVAGAGRGDSGDLASLDEAAFVVALSDAARESSNSGRRIAVQNWRAW